MSFLNAFSALRNEQSKPEQPKKFTFISPISTAAWGEDDSDDETPAFVVESAKVHDDEKDVSDSDESNSDSDQDDHSEFQEIPVTACNIPKITSRTLSKKEKKQQEMDDLDSALAELGLSIPAQNDKDIEVEKEPLTASDQKMKKKKKNKKTTIQEASEANMNIKEEEPEILQVDIKAIIKNKAKKKKSKSQAIMSALKESDVKSNKKSKRDKSKFNQAPTS